MQNNDIFRMRLRKLREEKPGLKQRTLSELCGLSSDLVRRYERGEITDPNVSSVEALADFFDVSVEYLLGRTDRKNF